jgi:phosphate:Na+ symporter
MTDSRIKGVLTGLLVTTTIQSSSATTVMMVSFVNAGLLSLIGAVGVIMGANIGTTVTAWLISIIGFKISLSFLSLPLIGLSFPLFISKNSIRKSWGEFLVGFAVLFIGLQFLKDAVPDIRSNPQALQFLNNFTNSGYLSVFVFVIIGTVFTIIIQSSSATMALTLVLCYNGVLPFELAAAMVLGENIGTTITANLAAIVANVSARRAARAHLVFNLFGVTWMLIVFYPFLRGIDYLMQMWHESISILATDLDTSDFQQIKHDYPIALALYHTTFNILNTFLLFGFAPLIAQIATRMVPGDEDDEEEFRLKYIGSPLVSTSEISIMQAKKEVAGFGSKLQRMFGFLTELQTLKYGKKFKVLLARIEKYEDITDNIEGEVADFLTQVSEGEISHESSKDIRAMLTIIDDLESAADVIFQLSRVIDNNVERKVHLNEAQIIAINNLSVLVEKAIGEMIDNLNRPYRQVKAIKATEIEHTINAMRDSLRQKHADDLKEKKYKHKVGAYYSDLYSMIEKVADYIINVSEALAETNKGSMTAK